MKSLSQPKTLTVYYLLKQMGLNLTTASIAATGVMSQSLGFFMSAEEAEMNRTMEILKNTITTGSSIPQFHIYELEIPNPAYVAQKLKEE